MPCCTCFNVLQHIVSMLDQAVMCALCLDFSCVQLGCLDCFVSVGLPAALPTMPTIDLLLMGLVLRCMVVACCFCCVVRIMSSPWMRLPRHARELEIENFLLIVGVVHGKVPCCAGRVLSQLDRVLHHALDA